MFGVGVLFNFFDDNEDWKPSSACLVEFLFNYEPS